MELQAKEMNAFFDALSEVHINKEKYSIEWAFEDAQKKWTPLSKRLLTTS